MTPSPAPATLVSSAPREPSHALTASPLRPGPALRRSVPATWLAAGLLAVAGVAGAAYWAGRAVRTGAPPEPSVSSPQPLSGQAAPEPVFSPAAPTAKTHDAPHAATAGGPAPVRHPTANAAAGGPAPAQAAAPVCSQCGVVETVQAVQRKGEASGVGAVAGGVLGGVLGNQMGKGNGRAAMTVLGAVGGGLAGNEVEKRSKAVTVYRVTVRTDSGATRTLEQSTAPTVGERVRIDGTRLHPINP